MKERTVRLKSRRRSQRGVALITAIAGALLVSITAAAAISITWRRFELSAMRTDRAVTLAAAESGLQYAFARLDLDAPFQTRVRDKRNTVALMPGITTPNDPRIPGATYVVRCHTDFPRIEDGQRVDALHMYTEDGGKHVTIRIRFMLPQDNPPDPARPYEVRGEATRRVQY